MFVNTFVNTFVNDCKHLVNMHADLAIYTIYLPINAHKLLYINIQIHKTLINKYLTHDIARNVYVYRRKINVFSLIVKCIIKS
jgi:hypothetical protein